MLFAATLFGAMISTATPFTVGPVHSMFILPFFSLKFSSTAAVVASGVEPVRRDPPTIQPMVVAVAVAVVLAVSASAVVRARMMRVVLGMGV